MVENFKDIQKAILDGVNDPRLNDKGRRDVVDAMLQQLKQAIDDENSGKILEIQERKDQQLQLEQVLKTAKTKSMQDSMTAAIDQLSLEIQQLEAQILHSQAVYEDLLQEMVAKLDQRVQEVRNGAKVLPFADLQAANLATDLKVKALEEKLDDALVVNEQLIKQIDEQKQQIADLR